MYLRRSRRHSPPQAMRSFSHIFPCGPFTFIFSLQSAFQSSYFKLDSVNLTVFPELPDLNLGLAKIKSVQLRSITSLVCYSSMYIKTFTFLPSRFFSVIKFENDRTLFFHSFSKN